MCFPLTFSLSHNLVLGILQRIILDIVRQHLRKLLKRINFSALTPLLSSYIYVSSVYLLTNRIVTGTSGFGVSTLLAPVVSAPLGGLSRSIVIALNALIVMFSLLMIYASPGAVPIVFIVALYVTFFVTVVLLIIDALMKQKSIVRKLVALGLDSIAVLLAWNSYLRPSPEGAFVNHLVILSVFFVLSSIMASLINRTE